MTCGPSCALMCYAKITKLVPGQQFYWNDQRIRDAYGEWQGKPYDGSAAGTYPEGLVYALNKFNIGNWTQTNAGGAGAVDIILRRVGMRGLGPVVTVDPIIVGIDWDGSTASHWVCIDTVRAFNDSLYATVCDPWDAGLHVQKIKRGANFAYRAAETFDFDFGGTHYNYGSPELGRVDTWPIIHRT